MGDLDTVGAEGADTPSEIVTPPQPLSSQAPVKESIFKTPDSVKVRKSLDQAKTTVKGKIAAEREKARLEGRPYKGDKIDHVAESQKDTQHGKRRAAIENAVAKVNAEDEAKNAAAQSYKEPPVRFSQDAKAEWANAPESVRREVSRATREMEDGIQKYRGHAQAWESVRHYDEIARRNGGNLAASLGKVAEIEAAFTRNPIEGLQRVCQHFGMDLHKVASHIAQMRPEQLQAHQAQSQVHSMHAEMQQLREQTAQVIQHVQRSAVVQNVDSFAKSHPRFDELSDEIAKEVSAGYGLEEAYDRAVRLSGTGQLAKAIDKGQKSISGAPAGGVGRSLPRKSNSVRESLQRAFGSV